MTAGTGLPMVAANKKCVVFPNELSGSATWLQAPVEEKADRNESKTE